MSTLGRDHKNAARMRHFRHRMSMKTKFLKIIGAGLAAALICVSPLRAAEPSAVGLWEQLDEHGHSWFLFFERNGVYEGGIVKMFLKPGENPNRICAGCTGDQKNAPVLGLVIVKNMHRNSLAYENGTITDPRNGSVYQAKMKISPDGQRLTVRGFLGIDLFGQDQIWKRLPDDAMSPSEVPANLAQYLPQPTPLPVPRNSTKAAQPAR
jgi:uncharacterized protein (DUF2147 family)